MEKFCSTAESDCECSGAQNEIPVASLECLPNEILAQIASHLDYYDLDQLKAVNRRFNQICQLTFMDSYHKLLKDNNTLLTYLMKQFRCGNQIITSPKLFVALEKFFKDLEFPSEEKNCPPFVSGAKLDFAFRVCDYYSGLDKGWDILREILIKVGVMIEMEPVRRRRRSEIHFPTSSS